MTFHTVSSLIKELKTQKAETQIDLSITKVKFGIVTFSGEKQQDVIYVGVHHHNWNFIDLYGPGLCDIGSVIEYLEPFLGQHGNNYVLCKGYLIESIRTPVLTVTIQTSDLVFYETPMNSNHKFRKEFETAWKSVLNEDQDLMLCWLRKKLPDQEKIYLIGTEYHFGCHTIQKQVGESVFDKIFVSDSKCDRIYVANIGLQQFKMLAGTLTNEEKLQQLENWKL